MFQTQWVRGFLGHSGPCVQSAVVEDSNNALASVTYHLVVVSADRAKPVTPKSVSVTPNFPLGKPVVLGSRK